MIARRDTLAVISPTRGEDHVVLATSGSARASRERDERPPLDGRSLSIPRADGRALAGEAFGDDAAPLVVLLHGGGQSRSAWRGAARRFAASGLRAATMDLRGHGDSDWSGDGAYTFDDYVDDLVRTIDALQGPAIVVGASLGGHVALITAARHPDRVRALVLADVTPWIDETVGDTMRDGMRAAVSGFATVEEAAAMVDGLRNSVGPRDASRLRPFLRQGADGRLYWKWDPKFLNDTALRHGGVGGLFEAEARKLTVPVLAMRAERITITSPAQFATFKATVPWLESVTIAKAGHMVTGDVNDDYADAALAFVDRLPPLGDRQGEVMR